MSVEIEFVHENANLTRQFNMPVMCEILPELNEINVAVWF